MTGTPRTTFRMLPVTLGTMLLLSFAACGGGDTNSSSANSEGRDTEGGVRVTTDANDSTALADAEVKITSTDGAITLAVLHDSVVMQLSDSLRQSIAAKVDSSTSAEATEGMGGAIAKVVGSAVKAAVTSAMGIAVRAPASQMNDLRYENGRLFFKVEGNSVKINAKGEGSSDGIAFSEADAKAFIDAVEKAKARSIAM